jgi:hypothetical protein
MALSIRGVRVTYTELEVEARESVLEYSLVRQDEVGCMIAFLFGRADLFIILH